MSLSDKQMGSNPAGVGLEEYVTGCKGEARDSENNVGLKSGRAQIIRAILYYRNDERPGLLSDDGYGVLKSAAGRFALPILPPPYYFDPSRFSPAQQRLVYIRLIRRFTCRLLDLCCGEGLGKTFEQ